MTDNDEKVIIKSYNQSGGITAQTVNTGKPPRKFDNEHGLQIKALIPQNANILVVCLFGDSEGYNFAYQALQWLKQNGYKNIEGVTQVTSVQPLKGQDVLLRSENNYEFVVGAQE